MLLTNKNFLFLWISQILSQLTVNVMNFLLLARIFELTSSSIATSLLWIAFSLPAVFFGSIGATTVDLLNRKKILMFTNLLQSLVLVFYFFTHETSIFMLYFVVIAYSFLNQFYVPAEMSTLPSIVKNGNLSKANSLFFFTQQLTLILGFVFAGIMQNIFGFKVSIFICGTLLFIAFVSVCFLPNTKEKISLNKSFEELLRTFFNKVVEGYVFIKHKKSILYPLSLLFLIQVSLAIVVTILPQIATEILNVAVSLSGVMIVVPVGIGAFIGSLVVNKLLKQKVRKKNIIEIGLFLLSFGTLLVVFANKLIAPISVLFIGLGFVMINIPTLTFLQQETPTWLRGRVFGNLFFFVTLASIIPVLFSGIISEIFGVKSLLTILSIFVILTLVYSIKKGNKLIQDNF